MCVCFSLAATMSASELSAKTFSKAGRRRKPLFVPCNPLAGLKRV